MNAIRNAITIGSGCGNSGNKDNANAMLVSVKMNVNALSMVGTRARCAVRFVFCFAYQSLKPLKPEGGFKPFIFNFNDVDLKPYFIKRFLRFVVKRFLKSILKKGKRSRGKDTSQTSEAAVLDIQEKADAAEADLAKPVEGEEAKSVETDVAGIEAVPEPQETRRQTLPKQALICIGEYPGKILIHGKLSSLKDEVQPIFVEKSSEEVMNWGKDLLDSNMVTGLDADVDAQFWYQVSPYLADNQELFKRIRGKLEGNELGVLSVSSLWDGIGSAMSPILISKLREWNMAAVTLGLSPSRLQASTAHFNALSSIGMCLGKESAALILLGRDQLNEYVGVDRTGSVLRGNMVLNSIVEMMLAKATFVKEFSELSRSLDVKAFTVLAATGASLKVYGSLEKVLDSTTFRPLQAFDLSGASLLYVLVRLPSLLKERLTRDKIELVIADWFKDRAVLKSVYVTEPLYVEDVTDRVDLLLFVGGFDLTGMLATTKTKAEVVKTQAVKKGLIKEGEWKEIVKSIG
jgi:hypothetical protein